MHEQIEKVRKIILPKEANDERGFSRKIFSEDYLGKMNLNFKVEELFVSSSKKNVIRGMHFQKAPYAQKKIVYVLKGKIMDVVLDIRKGSPSFMKYESFEIDEKSNFALYIPRGYAHGFKAVGEQNEVLYAIEGDYVKEADGGIHINSFGFDWNIESPIMSDRDKNLKNMIEELKENLG